MFSCRINLDINQTLGNKSIRNLSNLQLYFYGAKSQNMLIFIIPLHHFNFSTQNNGPPPTLVDLANGTNPMPSLAPPTQSELSAPSSVQSQNISPLTGIQFNVSDFKPSKTSRQLCEENGIRYFIEIWPLICVVST